MKFRFVFWDVLPCKIIVIALMLEAARTSETSVDNYFLRQYIPEDKSELPHMDVCFHVISSNQALEESRFGSDPNDFGTQTFQ
jgi:hypothetical protein